MLPWKFCLSGCCLGTDFSNRYFGSDMVTCGRIPWKTPTQLTVAAVQSHWPRCHCIRPLKHLGRGFESHSRHGCICQCCNYVPCRQRPCRGLIPRPGSHTDSLLHEETVKQGQRFIMGCTHTQTHTHTHTHTEYYCHNRLINTATISVSGCPIHDRCDGCLWPER
jgi:hypothetical protein